MARESKEACRPDTTIAQVTSHLGEDGQITIGVRDAHTICFNGQEHNEKQDTHLDSPDEHIIECAIKSFPDNFLSGLNLVVFF